MVFHMQWPESTVDAVLFGIRGMKLNAQACMHACMQEQVGDNEGSWQSFADSRMMCNETPACPVAYHYDHITITTANNVQSLYP